MKTVLRHLFLVPFLALVAGCAMTLEYGRWPDTDQLGKLRLGQSDSAEVRQLLGEPTGKGQGRMPDFPGTATVWSYEYQRISAAAGSDVEINVLMVFLSEGIYQGHFWFEAVDKMQVSEVSR